MSIDRSRFGVNRKVAPALSIERFFALAHRIGLTKVELRNDLASGRVTDDLTHGRVRELAAANDLEIITLNAAYPFNQLTADTEKLVSGLLNDAQGVGAKALVLCPLNDGTPVPESVTVDALRRLGDLLGEADIQGLVEPLGFRQSSLRSAAQAQRLIHEAEVPFKVLIDSFHQHLYEGASAEFPSQVDVSGVGLVHLSGIESTKPTDELLDGDRYMLTDKDVMDNVGQVHRLENLGYAGTYSFEPFADALGDWSEDEIERQINQSIDLVNAGL